MVMQISLHTPFIKLNIKVQEKRSYNLNNDLYSTHYLTVNVLDYVVCIFML